MILLYDLIKVETHNKLRRKIKNHTDKGLYSEVKIQIDKSLYYLHITNSITFNILSIMRASMLDELIIKFRARILDDIN